MSLFNSTNLIDAVHNESALWDTTTNFSEEGEWENCAPYLQILATPLVPSPFAWLLFRSSVVRQICTPYVK